MIVAGVSTVGSESLTMLGSHLQKLMQQLGRGPTDASSMFLDGAFEQEGQQKLLDCAPLHEEVEIKNKSCTLTPQVTQGESRL